jgi:hypothetical protein
MVDLIWSMTNSRLPACWMPTMPRRLLRSDHFGSSRHQDKV